MMRKLFHTYRHLPIIASSPGPSNKVTFQDGAVNMIHSEGNVCYMAIYLFSKYLSKIQV